MNDAPRTLFEVTPGGDQAGRSVGAVLANLPASQRRLAEAISSAVGLPGSGIGLTAAAKAVGAAAEAIGRPGLRSQSGALQQALELGTGRDAAFDLALLLEGHRDHVVAAVFLRPDAFVVTSAAARNVAHLMHRLLVHAVDKQIKLAPIGPQSRLLMHGTSPLARSLRDALGGEPGALQAWAETAGSGPWRRLARLLHEARLTPLSDPVVQPREPADDRPPPKFRPFVIQKLVSTRARNVYHQAGLASFDQSLAPVHFERLAPVLRAALVDDDGQHFAAALYFAMLFGLYPRQFDRVSFEAEPDGLQIDLARGVVRFSLRSVARKA